MVPLNNRAQQIRPVSKFFGRFGAQQPDAAGSMQFHGLAVVGKHAQMCFDLGNMSDFFQVNFAFFIFLSLVEKCKAVGTRTKVVQFFIVPQRKKTPVETRRVRRRLVNPTCVTWLGREVRK